MESFYTNIAFKMFFQGDHIWLDPPPKTRGEFEVAIGGRIQFADSGQLQVVDDDGKVRKVHPGKGADDFFLSLCTLQDDLDSNNACESFVKYFICLQLPLLRSYRVFAWDGKDGVDPVVDGRG